METFYAPTWQRLRCPWTRVFHNHYTGVCGKTKCFTFVDARVKWTEKLFYIPYKTDTAFQSGKICSSYIPQWRLHFHNPDNKKWNLVDLSGKINLLQIETMKNFRRHNFDLRSPVIKSRPQREVIWLISSCLWNSIWLLKLRVFWFKYQGKKFSKQYCLPNCLRIFKFINTYLVFRVLFFALLNYCFLCFFAPLCNRDALL